MPSELSIVRDLHNLSLLKPIVSSNCITLEHARQLQNQYPYNCCELKTRILMLWREPLVKNKLRLIISKGARANLNQIIDDKKKLNNPLWVQIYVTILYIFSPLFARPKTKHIGMIWQNYQHFEQFLKNEKFLDLALYRQKQENTSIHHRIPQSNIILTEGETHIIGYHII